MLVACEQLADLDVSSGPDGLAEIVPFLLERLVFGLDLFSNSQRTSPFFS